MVNKTQASALLPLAHGWWGKVPARGDFVGQGLPGDGQQVWDRWLQQSLELAARRLGSEALRERLGAMPVWHFVVLPRQRGAAWCGAVMASCDRVGRAFPLLLAEAFETGALLHADIAALRTRAVRLSRLAGQGAPADIEARLARLGETPLAPSGPSAAGCTLGALRSAAPSAVSFWWCIEPPSDPRYPYAEPWPPQHELLFDLLAVVDQP